PDNFERQQSELQLQVALGGTLLAASGWAAPEMGRAYKRARELCLEGHEPSLLVTALWGLFQFHQNRAELNASLAAAEDLLLTSERQDDAAVQAMGHRFVGGARLLRGQPEAAMPELERARAIDPNRHTRRILIPMDNRVSGLSFLAL